MIDVAGSTKQKTGIGALDKMLGGGLPIGSNVLLYGKPMCGKKPLMMEFAYEGLKQGIPCIFILTDYSYEDWKKMMAGSGWNIAPYEAKKMVRIIDAYSRQFDPEIRDTPVVSFPETPSAMNSISLHVARAQADIYKIKDHHNLCFHSLSSLMQNTNPQTVFRFLQFMIGKFRKVGATCMYTVEKGMHEEKDMTMVQHLMDGMIEFDDSNEKLRVNGVVGADRNWHKIKMSDKGVEIKD